MKNCQEEIRINFEKKIPEEADVRMLKRITGEILKTGVSPLYFSLVLNGA